MRRAAGIAIAALALAAVLVIVARSLSRHRESDATVEVQGGDGGGLPRARPQEERFDEAALERVPQDRVADGLQALVVMRDDHIVFERYGRGLGAGSIIDSGHFATALLALAAGVASEERVLSAQALRGFEPDALRGAIEQGSQLHYEVYLSRYVWSRLNAAAAWIALPVNGAAVPADCCFHARVLDWLRVASVLLGDGRFEGTQVVPSGWVQRMVRPLALNTSPGVAAGGVANSGFGVELATGAHGAEPFAAEGVFFLRGPGRWRLWLVPGLRLAVLFGAATPDPGNSASAGAWDETRLPNLVMRTLSDRPAQPGDLNDLQRLVPGH